MQIHIDTDELKPTESIARSGRTEHAGVFSSFKALLSRDLLLAARRPSELANPLVFFLLVITLLPLGMGPEPKLLATVAPGMLWVVALLASLLSLDSLFRADYEDGSLEQLLIRPQALYFSVQAKVLLHWLLTGLPLSLLAPLLGVLLNLPEAGYATLSISLLLGTASLSLIGAIGAALTVALRRGGLVLSLIVIPLYVPVLIFGASAVQSAIDGYAVAAQLAVLGAILAVSLILAPLAVAAALRMAVNN